MEYKEIFIGSSSEGLRYSKKLKELLDVKLQTYGIKCVLWDDENVFILGRTTIENLCQKANSLKKHNGYAIMIITPDDKIQVRGETRYLPRDNVVFELGLFLGTLGRERTYCVTPCNVAIKMMSDWSGVTNATYEYSDTKTDEDLVICLEKAVKKIIKAIDCIERPKVNNIQFEYNNGDFNKNSELNKNVFQIIENNIEKQKKIQWERV